MSSPKEWPRCVFHVDMDAFFASVEQRDHPAYRGKPVVVGGLGDRGVVSTASYEARAFGIKSAMPMFQARRLCPQAVFLAPRMSVYSSVSRALMSIFESYSPLVEPLSLDEAFLDMTGTESLLGCPSSCAARLQEQVRDELSLTASVGVATTKFLAKIASDLRKPSGLTLCEPGAELAILHPLPVERLWGVGPKTAKRLHALALHTIGDVARADPMMLQGRLGEALGRHLYELASGMDPRPVEHLRARKSLGAERTLQRDLTELDTLRDVTRPLCEEVARLLRVKQLRTSSVRLKVKFADFSVVTKQLRLPEPVLDAQSLRMAVESLLRALPLRLPVRLVGVAATDLQPAACASQVHLFAADAARQRNERLDFAIDAVHEKFGKGTLQRGQSAPLFASTPNRSRKD